MASFAYARRIASYRSLLRRIAVNAAIAGLLPVLSGCILTADKLDPTLDVPARYREAHGPAGAALPNIEWWRGFRSAELIDLMEQARAANLDIGIAVARIVQADAQARVTGAALLPTVTGTASAERSRPSGALFGGAGVVLPDRSTYTTAVSASYVVDFWGRNRALTRAAEQTSVASRFDREVVALTALVAVADTYFLVLEGQDRLRVARSNLASAEGILKVIQDRLAQGTADPLAVAQQASLVAIQRASIPPLIVQVEQNKATLGLLVGRTPEHITIRGGSLYRLAVPRVTPGLPSQLLTQRPDIREAEARLAGADANVEAARAAFFPNIQLTGQEGLQSAMLRTLFSPPAFFYSVAANLTQPIFDGGLLLGQLDLQRGLREELLQTYRKAVISAFTDVEKALVAVAEFAREEVLQRAAVEEAQRAYDLMKKRFEEGTIDIQTLLQVQATLFSTQDTLATVRFARLQAIVSLFQALGGGWQVDKRLEREAKLHPDRGPP
jgi:NodT family efflux transporter outer membrane factor (OMF) lipoprotein